MNQDQAQGKWEQLKGASKVLWGKLTDDDFKKVEGNAEKLYGLIHEKYGDTKEVIQEKLEGLQKKELQKTASTGMGPMEEQLARWGERLDALVTRANLVRADAKDEYHKNLLGLREKYSAAQVKVGEFRSAGADKWDTFKADMEVAWLELEGAFKKLTTEQEKPNA